MERRNISGDQRHFLKLTWKCAAVLNGTDLEPNIRDGKDDNSFLRGEVPMAALKILYTVLATMPPSHNHPLLHQQYGKPKPILKASEQHDKK